ncbi:ABC transporter substrate-binding protein [Deinococcus soli (ex Cha et al. 2016)]|uniref:ABC transporter substrate-binding protein n=1 Tax=Deinococcus soli (ex Cha et al. 2016) TaxID=1309411 RepID=UPI00360FD59A
MPVVHIAQLFQKSGYTLVALNSSGIKTPADFKGKRVGVWPSGNEYPAVALLKKYGLTTTSTPPSATPACRPSRTPSTPASSSPTRSTWSAP